MASTTKTYRVPTPLSDRVKAEADALGVSVSKLVSALMSEYAAGVRQVKEPEKTPYFRMTIYTDQATAEAFQTKAVEQGIALDTVMELLIKDAEINGFPSVGRR